ncbi:MAG TPA: hypothetical protein VGQ58_05245 [Candidatus Limnocylindrales bacterium]|jgi:hypothetical protein|nr:hypothetical protein [Candidatus Limnocylindrales bacterium]
MRVAAVAQALVLGLFVVVVLSDAGLVAPTVAATYPWLIWVVVAFSAVSAVLNTITQRPRERRIWPPVALVMLASSLVVALNG